MKSNCFINPTSPKTKTTQRNFGTLNLRIKQRLSFGKIQGKFTGKELDPETGLYYFGARYLDPKTSRWLSGDPAVGEYIPGAPVNDEVRKQNQNLPGQGGVFNYVNLHVYHYAGNNPVRYVDPNGKNDEYAYDPGAVYETEEAAINAAQDFVRDKYTRNEFGGYIYSKEVDGKTHYGVRLKEGRDDRVEYSLDILNQDEERAVIEIHSHLGGNKILEYYFGGQIPEGATAKYDGIGQDNKGQGFVYSISFNENGNPIVVDNLGFYVSDEDRREKAKNPEIRAMVISPDTRHRIEY